MCKFLAWDVVFDFYRKKFFVATRIQKLLISIWYYQRNNLEGTFICTRFSFSTKQLLWRGTCLANHCKCRCFYVELPVRAFGLISMEAIHKDFYCIFLYKFLCSLVWGWFTYRPKHAAYMWRQFNWLNKIGTSLDYFFLGVQTLFTHTTDSSRLSQRKWYWHNSRLRFHKTRVFVLCWSQVKKLRPQPTVRLPSISVWN